MGYVRYTKPGEWLFLFGLFSTFVLIGLGVLISARWPDIRGSYFQSRADFRVAQGVIVSSSVEARNSRYGVGYHYVIVFRYEVSGVQYESGNVSFSGDGFRERGKAEEYTAKYPVGTSVAVYYDQHDPQFSALEIENRDQYMWAILLGGCFLPFIATAGLASLNCSRGNGRLARYRR